MKRCFFHVCGMRVMVYDCDVVVWVRHHIILAERDPGRLLFVSSIRGNIFQFNRISF